MATRTTTVEEPMYAALRLHRAKQEQTPTRERAVVITKLEEAILWNDVVRSKLGLHPLGVDYTP